MKQPLCLLYFLTDLDIRLLGDITALDYILYINTCSEGATEE